MADNIFNVLGFTGLELGNIQSVDEMTIIPILGEDRTKNTSDPEKVKFHRTRGYGSMEFENDDDTGFGIVPNNTMVISDRAAQDHAMAETGLLASKEHKTYDNACCIQQSQCGYLDRSDNEYNVLPVDLRRALLTPQKRSQHSAGKIWEDISRWLSDVPGIDHGRGHLEYFFRPFKKELEDFVAEFEPVEGQLGAVVFYNDTPVGIEIMPNVRHWNTYWKWLVRGCYGSQLLKLKKSGKLKAATMKLPSSSGVDLITKLDQFITELKATFVGKVNALQISTVGSSKNELPQVAKKLIRIGSGGGDVLIEKNKPIYLSSVI